MTGIIFRIANLINLYEADMQHIMKLKVGQGDKHRPEKEQYATALDLYYTVDRTSTLIQHISELCLQLGILVFWHNVDAIGISSYNDARYTMHEYRFILKTTTAVTLGALYLNPSTHTGSIKYNEQIASMQAIWDARSINTNQTS